MFSGPIRGGTRGGQGLFKWEDVKEDKHRENFLGHSLKAPVGRWQQNRDLTWYAKESSTLTSSKNGKKTKHNKDGEEEEEEEEDKKIRKEREELERIKQQEADALAMALGYSGPRLSKYKNEKIRQDEIKRVVKTAAGDIQPEGMGFSKRGSQSGKSSTFQRIREEKSNEDDSDTDRPLKKDDRQSSNKRRNENDITRERKRYAAVSSSSEDDDVRHYSRKKSKKTSSKDRKKSKKKKKNKHKRAKD